MLERIANQNGMRNVLTNWLLAVIVVCCLNACTPTTMDDKPIGASPEPLPPHIRTVTPGQWVTIPYSIFALQGLSEDVLWYGGQDFETGFKSAVCVKFNLRQLISAGDHFSYEFLENHSRLELNGEDQGRPEHIFAFSDLVTYQLPGGEAMSLPDAPFCWLVETEPGRQQVIVEFERTDGSVAVFDWQFMLTDDKHSQKSG